MAGKEEEWLSTEIPGIKAPKEESRLFDAVGPYEMAADAVMMAIHAATKGEIPDYLKRRAKDINYASDEITGRLEENATSLAPSQIAAAAFAGRIVYNLIDEGFVELNAGSES